MMKWIDIPPVWLTLALAVSWGGARLGFGWDAGGAAVIAGLVLAVAGVALMAATIVAFSRARTTVIPHEEPSALVTSGIMSFSRNPIYLGDALLLAGMSLIWGSVPGLATIPIFVWIIQTRFIHPEEARLQAAFGAAFERYKARVRRWF